MLERILPPQIDNGYRGQRLALWLFGAIALQKIGMGSGVVFNGYFVAMTADGLPMDSYPAAAGRAVVAMFALWGLGQLLLGFGGILALVRYRAAVPLVFGLFLLEHLSRKLILQLLPVVRTGTSPGTMINLILVSLMMVGFALSLLPRRTA